jgi:uncharacterized protein (DUF1697 family)
MPLHVAFLRGVGGPRPAPGAELRQCFAAAGYEPVVPVVATGNVVFGLGRKRKPPEAGVISELVARHFGYPLPAILRSGEAIRAMVASGVFRSVDPDRHVRFVAMLADDAPPASSLPEPRPDAGYALAARRGRDLFFVIERGRTPDLMVRLARTFRKLVTTRNWSTIERVAAVLGWLGAGSCAGGKPGSPVGRR